jgi:predicted DsbA family dithiol-disulfide isomerase
MAALRVQIWSDIACPWCYVGKRRLEGALASFDHRDAVEIRWRAFELDPAAPRTRPDGESQAQRLASKYRMSVAQAEQRMRELSELAAKDGLDLRFDRVRSGNTFDAHRLVALARTHGIEGAAKERLLRAYFTEGLAIGDAAVLTRLGADIGIDPSSVAEVLASGAFADEVRADERLASEMGISGVPFFVFDERFAVSGAQPSAVFASTLAQAFRESAPQAPGAGAEAAPACGADGCA